MSRDPLARLSGRTPTNDDELKAMRAAVWHRQGIPVLPLDQIANDFDRQHVINIANQLYGRRSKSEGQNGRS